MYRILAACLLTLAAASALAADGPATFAQLKSLAGSWSGRMEDPDKGPPVHVRYEVVSGGNQPAYRLGAGSTPERAVLEFAGGTGFDPKKDGHVHEGEIRFVAPDRIEHQWVHFTGEQRSGATRWFLARDTRAQM